MKKQKYYVVWKGRRTGIFETWAQASAQVNGFTGAQFKSFDTRALAEVALRQGPPYQKPWNRPSAPPAELPKPAERWEQLRLLGVPPPILPSYSADAACSGNPGVLEYRCVHTETGEPLFAQGPFPEGTNNIGEFLAIVETLTRLHDRHDALPIYSDSRNALSWIKDKKCKTKLVRNKINAPLFQRITAAEHWLHAHFYPNPVLKWDTDNWGEIPADYGRK